MNQDLDEMAAGVECGIRDTRAWKVLVSRVGEKEAARLLRLALFSRHSIQSDPSN